MGASMSMNARLRALLVVLLGVAVLGVTLPAAALSATTVRLVIPPLASTYPAGTSVTARVGVITGTTFVPRVLDVQRRPVGTPVWTTVATVRTGTTGGATVRFPLPSAGRFELRVLARATTTAGAGTSLTRTVSSVLRPSALSGWATASRVVAVGYVEQVHLTVTTTPAVSARPVEVQRRALGTTTWQTVATGTALNGSATIALPAPPAGLWEERAVAPQTTTASPAASGTRAVRTLAQQHLGVGMTHACAVIPAGSDVRCWGVSNEGALGVPGVQAGPNPVVVAGLDSPAVAVTTGSAHTCALTTSGSVWCWGANSLGQVGTGTVADSVPSPSRVTGLGPVAKVAADGASHTCALATDGTVWCWGGEALGSGTVGPSRTPVQVQSLGSDNVDIAVGMGQACATKGDGTSFCWGDNRWGQLANGTQDDALTPTPTLLPDAVQIVPGAYSHGCAALTDGTARCWGTNLDLELGLDVPNVPPRPSVIPTPGVVSGLTGVTSVATGQHFTCAVAEGAVKCWGYSRQGTLGNGTTDTDEPHPVQAIGLESGVAEVSAGQFTACALTDTGSVLCWGWNAGGLAGESTLVDAVLVPHAVPNLP